VTAGRENPPGLRVHRAICGVSFGFSIALLVSLAIRSDEYLRPLGVCFAALVAILWSLPALARRGRPVDWVLAVAALNLLLVVPELSLRLAGFHYESGIQFGYPRPIRMVAFEPDADLFWRLPSSDPDVNSLGFPGQEVAQPKPAGTFRILFLGDSCTYQGYSNRTEAILSAQSPAGIAVEAVNLGVPGYSSHQGRVLAEMYAERFEPDLVFAYFGWNDHWLAYGSVDAEKVVEVPEGVRATRLYREFANLRVLQLGRKLLRGARAEVAPLAEVRVPLDAYRRNLRALRDEFARLGVPVVFVTAPSAHRSRGVPSYLLEMKFAPDLRSVVRLHDRYVEATREVAAEDDSSGLLDLVLAVDAAGSPDAIFREDGIHFTDEGLEWAAERFAEAALPYVAAANDPR
jgi:lysophospholipase L1-like esterase